MPHRRKLAVATPKTAPKLRPGAIDKARTDAMVLIDRQARFGDPGNVFLDKARRLLTQHWAKADWTARATLLKTADWLIRVAAANPGPAPAPARATRKPERAG
jgi:hypothetical protein